MWFLYGLLIYISACFGVLIFGNVVSYLKDKLKKKPTSTMDTEELKKNVDVINQQVFEFFSTEEKLYCLNALTEIEYRARFLHVVHNNPYIIRNFCDSLRKETENNAETSPKKPCDTETSHK